MINTSFSPGEDDDYCGCGYRNLNDNLNLCNQHIEFLSMGSNGRLRILIKVVNRRSIVTI